MVSRGSKIQSVQNYPYFTETKKTGFPTVVRCVKLTLTSKLDFKLSQIETSRMLFQQVHTNDQEDTGGGTHKITIQFQAILVPTGDVEDKDYYITAGAEYGNEQYVWVGQEKVTVSRAARVCLNHVSKQNPVLISCLVILDLPSRCSIGQPSSHHCQGPSCTLHHQGICH